MHDFLPWSQPDASKTTPKVVVFESANPDFFLSHADVTLLSANPPPGAAESTQQLIAIPRLLQSITSTAFIASINGRAAGSGNEFAMAMDMRFAGPNSFAVNFENSLDSLAAGGGQLFMPALVGKARAMEHIAAAMGFDGPTGAAYGLFNRYFDTGEALNEHVDDVASRIGLFAQHSLNDTKFTLNSFNPSTTQLDAQVSRFMAIMSLPEVQEKVGALVTASGNQTKGAFELGIPDSILGALY